MITRGEGERNEEEEEGKRRTRKKRTGTGRLDGTAAASITLADGSWNI
jgi:hypothetical protein